MGNATIVNFASGETSPKSRGRFDIPSYNSSCRKMENFIPTPQGAAEFRPGFKFVVDIEQAYFKIHTFSLNDSDAYVLVFRASSIYDYCDLLIYDSDGTLVDSPLSSASLDRYLGYELADLRFAQSRDTLYITHPNHLPKKLTRAYTGGFSLTTYSRTNDPFPTVKVVTGYTQAAAGQITLDAAVTDESVIRIFWLNGNGVYPGAVPVMGDLQYRVVLASGTTYYLKDKDTGAAVDTTGWPAYSTTTRCLNISDLPISVAFFENRLCFFGTRIRPNTLFASRSPVNTTGAPRYDDFTGGTDADHACFFTLAPSNGRSDFATWLVGLPAFLMAGTVGGVFRVAGAGFNEPLTPTSVSVRQIDTNGCENVAPAASGARIFFIQRGGKVFRSFQHDVAADDFVSADDTKNADQIAHTPLVRTVFQTGQADRVWALRTDGELACMVFLPEENIRAWHRIVVAGTSAAVKDVCVLSRPASVDQLWVVVSRTVNGGTLYSLEKLTDEQVFPDIEDYYTGAANAVADAASYRMAVHASVKACTYLDSFETYNGTPATVISGLDHLKGETVTALADGVEVPGLTVSAGGGITLPTAASVVHVGLPYTGLLQTQNLEVGGRSGPAQAKPRNINALNIRFLNSKGGQYGTDLYHLYDIETEDPDALELADGSAAPVFNGIRALQHSDVWSTETDRNEKTVFIRQTKPFPCVVQFIDIEYETGDE